MGFSIQFFLEFCAFGVVGWGGRGRVLGSGGGVGC